MGLRSKLSWLLGSRVEPSDYAVADAYVGLRNMILTTKPQNFDATGQLHVHGILMETGHDKAVVTLVAIDDDTISLYFSGGGGILGLGAHEGPRTVARAWLQMASQFVNALKPACNTPLPTKAMTRFYLLTNKGIFTTEAREADFGENHHVLSPLFHKAHELIDNIRLVEENWRADPM